jgi:hypothetical protein
MRLLKPATRHPSRSCAHCFQKRGDHPFHPANFRIFIQFIHREPAIPPGFAKGFQHDIPPDAIAVFEQVRDRLGDGKYLHRPAFHRVPHDSRGKGRPAELHDPHRRIRNARRPCTARHGQPHMRRDLGSDAVKAKCREQANHAVRRQSRCYGKRIMPGNPESDKDRGRSTPTCLPRQAGEESGCVCPAEPLRMRKYRRFSEPF